MVWLKLGIVVALVAALGFAVRAVYVKGYEAGKAEVTAEFYAEAVESGEAQAVESVQDQTQRAEETRAEVAASVTAQETVKETIRYVYRDRVASPPQLPVVGFGCVFPDGVRAGLEEARAAANAAALGVRPAATGSASATSAP